MSKELDEFYKEYSARMTEIDDTPLVKVMDGGKFKLLSIEEYEEMTNKIADLEAKLAESEEQRKNAYKEGLLQKQFDKDMEIDQLKQELAEKEEQLSNNCDKCIVEHHELTEKVLELSKQLAEKEKEIEKITRIVAYKDDMDRSTTINGVKFSDEQIITLQNIDYFADKHNQDKISFAVEQLNLLYKTLKTEDVWRAMKKSWWLNNGECLKLRQIIDNQIKELKENK